jgi:hypothetical protein
MLDAYNARGIYSNENVGTFDFSDAVAEVLFGIGGHTHIDSINLSTAGIPIVVTDTDSYRTASEDYPYVVGTDQEQCFDVVTTDYTNSCARFVRIGRGVNRAVHYAVTDVSSTVPLTPIAITATGWVSGNSAIATVSDGVVTAVATGYCLITATDADGNMECWPVHVTA